MPDAPLIKRFLQHQSEFMSYLMAITRNFDAAEEIFQNAAVVVMEQALTPEPIHDFRAWAKEVVRRQALHYWQKEVRLQQVRSLEPLLLEQITRVFVDDPCDQALAQRETAALRQCLQTIATAQRRMLSLRYEQRASFAEIGQVLGKTEGAVQRSLSRIRKRLHDCVRQRLRWAEAGE